jgi:hypothetical protein
MDADERIPVPLQIPEAALLRNLERLSHPVRMVQIRLMDQQRRHIRSRKLAAARAPRQ